MLTLKPMLAVSTSPPSPTRRLALYARLLHRARLIAPLLAAIQLLVAPPANAEVEAARASPQLVGSVPAIAPRSSLYMALPRSDRQRLRADFAPFDALLMVYVEDWADALTRLLALVPGDVEPILLADEEEARMIGPWLESEGIDPGSVTVQVVSLDSPWVRDYAPLQILGVDGAAHWVDTVYHSDRPVDDALPEFLRDRFGVGVRRVDFPLDGGALISNGRGLCATTREALAEGGFDAGTGGQRRLLLAELGCDVLVTMPALSEELTKHVDLIAQFVAHDTVAVGEMSSDTDPVDAEILEEAVRMLRRGAITIGQELKIVRVPIQRGEDDIYYSWINGLRMGDLFLVPDFENADPRLQEAAQASLARAMPELTLVALPSEPMIRLGGAIHCITAQLNAGSGRRHARVGPAPSP